MKRLHRDLVACANAVVLNLNLGDLHAVATCGPKCDKLKYAAQCNHRSPRFESIHSRSLHFYLHMKFQVCSRQGDISVPAKHGHAGTELSDSHGDRDYILRSESVGAKCDADPGLSHKQR